MFLSPALGAALDRIAERAADVRRAYTSGALPLNDDVATPAATSDFSLDPLSVAAPDGAYFIVADERGRRSYTRDGSFTLIGGRLVTRGEGASVLGLVKPGDTPAPLAVDSVDESLGRVRDVAIDRDGTLTYRRETIDPRSGTRELQRASAGRIALAHFPAGTRLKAGDDGRSVAPAGVVAREGLAGDGDFGPIVALRRERSRIDVDESIVRLKEAYLAFDALQAAEAAKMHLGKTAMDLLK